MSIQDIVQETINKNPLAAKASIEEELKTRIRAILEAKDEDMNDEEE